MSATSPVKAAITGVPQQATVVAPSAAAGGPTSSGSSTSSAAAPQTQSSTTGSLPSHCRAVIAPKYGEPKDAIEIISNHEVPKPKLNEVIVKVAANSVNPIDWKILSGALATFIRLKLPYVIGADLSGTVAAVGSSASRLKVGDSVYCDRSADIQGAYAEYVAVPEVQLALTPKNINLVEAASVPLVGLTALQGMTRQFNVQPGHKVLVLGASGGVGTAAIQIAKLLGASEVIGVCSSKNEEFVTQLGATRVIAYDKAKWVEELKGADIDLVYDTLGGSQNFHDAQQHVLKSSGTRAFVTIAGDKQKNPDTGKLDISTVMSIAGPLIGRKAKSLVGGPQYTFYQVDAKSDASRKELDRITAWIEEGKYKTVVEKVFSVDEVKEMWNQSTKGRTRGKLVSKW